MNFLNNKPSLFKPADIIILFLACLLSIWLYTTFWFSERFSGPAQILQVQVASNAPSEYPLNRDRVLTIEGHLGSSLVEIKQGKARIIHSPCRNKYCVFHGWLSTAGESTACIPNQLSISLKGKKAEYDALNY